MCIFLLFFLLFFRLILWIHKLVWWSFRFIKIMKGWQLSIMQLESTYHPLIFFHLVSTNNWKTTHYQTAVLIWLLLDFFSLFIGCGKNITLKSCCNFKSVHSFSRCDWDQWNSVTSQIGWPWPKKEKKQIMICLRKGHIKRNFTARSFISEYSHESEKLPVRPREWKELNLFTKHWNVNTVSYQASS